MSLDDVPETAVASRIAISIDGGDPAALRLEVAGELCTASVPECDALVEDCFADGEARPVRLDLAEVGFLDARGVTWIVLLRARCAASGRHLDIERASSVVTRMLHICHIDTRSPAVLSPA